VFVVVIRFLAQMKKKPSMQIGWEGERMIFLQKADDVQRMLKTSWLIKKGFTVSNRRQKAYFSLVSDDAHVRGLIKKFGDYHDVRIYVGTAAFIAFTLAYFKST
jgi:hypothetical protein